jgi:16S rRNA (guanine(966)-N(2))-methyltransferase RsmD
MRIIAGEARGRRLLAPRDKTTRPLLDQTRGSLFATLGGILEGGRVLDLFSGVGSFGLEALSRGARSAVFVEQSRATLEILRRNIESLGFGPRCEVLQGDALRLPDLSREAPAKLALAFLDPPFKMFDHEKDAAAVFDRVDELLRSPGVEPDVIVLLRLPSKYKGHCPLEVDSRREYGESVVLRFSPSTSREG